MTNTARNEKISRQIDNQKKAGLYDDLKNGKLLKEERIIHAMKIADIKYHGAIDSQNQDSLFDFYGILFIPSRNNGNDMWEALSFINKNYKK